MAQLAFNLNDGNEFLFDVEEEVLSLGRANNNAIVIDNSYISSRHAEFRRVPGSGDYMIVDLGSSNGIEINGQKVERALLKDGDKLMLGQLACRYYSGKAPQKDSPQENKEAPSPPLSLPRPQPPQIKKLIPPTPKQKPPPTGEPGSG